MTREQAEAFVELLDDLALYRAQMLETPVAMKGFIGVGIDRTKKELVDLLVGVPEDKFAKDFQEKA